MHCKDIGIEDPKGKKPLTMSRNHATKAITRQANRIWEPPPLGWVKINVDGSFIKQSGEAGAAAVARDDSGKVIFAAWRSFEHCDSALGIEALASVEGLCLAIHWRLSKVILELDVLRWQQGYVTMWWTDQKKAR